MKSPESKINFWLGNGILAVALLILLFMEQVWNLLGSGTMVLWILLVGAGIYFLVKDKSEPPTFPG